MPPAWRDRLLREAIHGRFRHHDLYYHVSLRPAAPPEWVVPDMAALTWRLGERHEDAAPVAATVLWPPGVVRIGANFGLGPASAFALVDSHERLHTHLAIEGIPEDEQEPFARIADAAYLALHDPEAERIFEEEGLARLASGRFWETLLARGAKDS